MAVIVEVEVVDDKGTKGWRAIDGYPRDEEVLELRPCDIGAFLVNVIAPRLVPRKRSEPIL